MSTPTELLDNSGAPAPKEGRSRRRPVWIIGGLAGVVAVAGTGLWAWSAYFSQGAQPAEALPADTLVYASIDLDPPANQKVEAIKTLRSFPSFRDEVDINPDDDLREKLLGELHNEGVCKDVDFKDDIEPWLGDRAAAAMVPSDDEGSEPDPVVVLQISDQDEAEKKLADLVGCLGNGGNGDEVMNGYAFHGDWAVLAETEKIADRVVGDAEESNLDDDGTYQKWMDRAGDPGVMAMYASPGTVDALVDADAQGSQLFPGYMDVLTNMKDFDGGAAVVRFNDKGMELEFAADTEAIAGGSTLTGGKADDLLSDLPSSTAVAVGGALEDGWMQELLDTFGTDLAHELGMKSVEEMISEVEKASGIQLPDDPELLTSEGVVVSLDSEFNVQELDEGPDAFPAGVRFDGDPQEIQKVIDRVNGKLPADEQLLSQQVEGGVIVTFAQTYLDTLAKGGDLGDSDQYEEALPEIEDASAALFVDFNEGDWFDRSLDSEGPSEENENFKQLKALGLTVTTDGDVTTGLLRVTVD